MDESIWIDTRIEVVYYAWFGRDHIAFVLDKLQAGISSDYERYDYAINRKANNKAFLERVPDMIAEGYENLSEQLAGLLSSYVKRMANKYNTNYINKYYYDWLTTTKTLCANYPVIVSWCDNYWTYLNGDGFSIVGKERDEPRVIVEMLDAVSLSQEGEQHPPQAIEENHDTKPSLPQPQPKAGVSADELYKALEQYFSPRFKGEVGNGIDNLRIIVDSLRVDIITEQSQRWFCMIALLIFECPGANKRHLPNVFSKWLSMFCEIVGCGVPKDKSKNKYKPNDRVKERYIILT